MMVLEVGPGSWLKINSIGKNGKQDKETIWVNSDQILVVQPL